MCFVKMCVFCLFLNSLFLLFCTWLVKGFILVFIKYLRHIHTPSTRQQSA